MRLAKWREQTVLDANRHSRRAFAAGTDISQFRALDREEDALAYEERMDRVLGAIERGGYGAQTPGFNALSSCDSVGDP